MDELNHYPNDNETGPEALVPENLDQKLKAHATPNKADMDTTSHDSSMTIPLETCPECKKCVTPRWNVNSA